MSKYDDLVKKLKEIFQIDRPELDFGVYRILNARAGEINDYLEKQLKAKVQASLSRQAGSNRAAKIKELAAKIRDEYGKRAFDDQGNLAYEEVQECALGRQWLQMQSATPTAAEYENAVFSHLLTFFSRYYDKGDFISQRRYKGDTYAIPYAGEEVVLHWANKDQYYTKSGENFSNYAFTLSGDDNAGRTVRFQLVTADTAKDNRKDNDKERRFVLIEQYIRTLADDEGEEYEEELLPIEEVNGELVLRFEYKAMPKGTRQETMALDAVNKVLGDANVKAHWLDLSKREPTEKNPHRTLLEKHLANYTTKNTADYFIHKDLGRFLRGELDFYIKNEVMNLDDVQNADTFAHIEKNLRLIQTLRAIALDVITFLAQLEDFQKKLWLKKKFIVSTNYCITIDRVPESLYPAIAANPKQWEQWDKLGMLDDSKTELFRQGEVGSMDYLKEHPYLMVDTALFDASFKSALLAEVDGLDERIDGLLIHGDNFQALNLLQERYREQVKCIYRSAV
jgi:adenine-specific DNA-methyltransferase